MVPPWRIECKSFLTLQRIFASLFTGFYLAGYNNHDQCNSSELSDQHHRTLAFGTPITFRAGLELAQEILYPKTT